MNERLQLDRAKRETDAQNQKSYQPFKFIFNNPYFDNKIMEKVDHARNIFERCQFSGDVTDKDGVCLNMVYDNLQNSESYESTYAKNKFDSPASFVEYYKRKMNLDHIDQQG